MKIKHSADTLVGHHLPKTVERVPSDVWQLIFTIYARGRFRALLKLGCVSIFWKYITDLMLQQYIPQAILSNSLLYKLFLKCPESSTALSRLDLTFDSYIRGSTLVNLTSLTSLTLNKATVHVHGKTISQLKNLVYLRMDRDLPSPLHLPSTLQTLHLGNCSFRGYSGSLPTSLTALTLPGDKSLPKNMKQLTNLKVLRFPPSNSNDIHWQNIVEIWIDFTFKKEHVASLPNLKSLSLELNGDIEKKVLKKLNLRNFRTKKNIPWLFSEISHMTNLHTLHCPKCDSNFDESTWKKLSNITNLNVAIEPESKLRTITSLTKLVSLQLHRTSGEDHVLSNFTHLTALDISGCSIPKCLDLSKLTSLTALGATRRMVDSDISPLTNLTFLNIGYLREITHEAVSGLTNMVVLDMMNNRSLPSMALKNMKKLRSVAVYQEDTCSKEWLRDLNLTMGRLPNLNYVCTDHSTRTFTNKNRAIVVSSYAEWFDNFDYFFAQFAD